MTPHDPSSRDEIVAAYLDGEATSSERALVEADPELLEQVEVMRQIAALVAEPVVPPPLEVRNSHLAAALAESATAPNVTAIASRRRWATQHAAVLSVAAVILVALLAVPILLVRVTGGDDDDTATSILAGDAAEEAGNDAGGESAFEELATTDADDTDPAPQAAAQEPADEAAEEPVEASAAEPAPTPAAGDAAAAAESDEEPAEEAALADDGSSEVAGTLDPAAPALLAGSLVDVDALTERVESALATDPAAQRSVGEVGLPLQCEPAVAEFADGLAVALVGWAIVGGEPVEFVVVETAGDRELIVVSAGDCTTVAAETVELG